MIVENSPDIVKVSCFHFSVYINVSTLKAKYPRNSQKLKSIHKQLNVSESLDACVHARTHTLTGAMILVPQCNNLQEMQVQGLQSKKNLHREYREGYLTQQLSSVACHPESKGS